MIKQPETVQEDGSALTAQEYIDIQGTGTPYTKVVYERLLPRFDWHPTQYWKTRSGTPSSDWDAVVFGQNCRPSAGVYSYHAIVRAWMTNTTTLYTERLLPEAVDGYNSWSSPYTVTSSLIDANTVRPTFWVDRSSSTTNWDHGRLFWNYNNYIYYADTTNAGTSWGTPVQIPQSFSGNEILAIAAISETVCFVMAKYQSGGVYGIYFSSVWWDGDSWEKADTEVMLPYVLSAADFCAEVVAKECYDERMALFVTHLVPPLLSKKGEGSNVENVAYHKCYSWMVSINRVGTDDPNAWEYSLTKKIHGYDMFATYQNVTSPRMNMLRAPLEAEGATSAWRHSDESSGLYVLTSNIYDGISKLPPRTDDYQCPVYQLSNDGINWTMPMLLMHRSTDPGETERDAPYIGGTRVLRMGQWVYLLSRDGTWRAPMPRMFCYPRYSTDPIEQPHPAAVFDSEHYASGIQVTQSEMRQTNVTLEDSEDALSSSILSEPGLLQARIFMGKDAPDGTRLLMLVGTEIVDSVAIAEAAGRKTFSVTSRDTQALLNDIMEADGTIEYVGNTVGVDYFPDLSHTAGDEGTWSVNSNQLIATHDEPTSAKAKFVWRTDVYNGRASIGFKMDANSEDVGRVCLMFHYIDVDNFDEIRYTYDGNETPGSDHQKIHFREIRAGTEFSCQEVCSGLTYSPGSWYYIMIDLFMLQVKVYTKPTFSDAWTYRGIKCLSQPDDAAEGAIQTLTYVPRLTGPFGVRAVYSDASESNLLYTYFREFEMCDDAPRQTTADVLHAMTSAAGILRLDTGHHMKEIPDEDGNYDLNEWGHGYPEASTSGVFSIVSNELKAVRAAEAGDAYLWYDHETPENFSLEFYKRPYSAVVDNWDWAIMLRGNDHTECYLVRFLVLAGPSYHVYIQSLYTGQKSEIVHYFSQVAHMEQAVRINVWELKTDWTNDDPEFLIISVYINGELICFLQDDISSGRPGLYMGVFTNDDLTQYWSNFRIRDLSSFVDWASIDAGQGASSGVGQIVRQRPVEFFSRFDGTLRAREAAARSVDWTLTRDDIYQFNTAWTRAGVTPQFRIIGAEPEGGFFDWDLISDGWTNGYLIYSDPDLWTQHEVVTAADKLRFRLREAAESCQFVMDVNPLIEVGDRVSIEGYDDWTVVGIQYGIAPAANNMNVACRRYDPRRDD